MTEPEWQTRKERIDKKLKALNPAWKIIKYSHGLDTKNLHKCAIGEFPSANGTADFYPPEQHEIVHCVEEHIAFADQIEVVSKKQSLRGTNSPNRSWPKPSAANLSLRTPMTSQPLSF
jgi:hypothetical protein